MTTKHDSKFTLFLRAGLLRMYVCKQVVNVKSDEHGGPNPPAPDAGPADGPDSVRKEAA